MVEGVILSRQEFNDYVLNKMNFPKEDKDKWSSDNRGDHTLQVCIVCDKHMRCLWLNINEGSFAYFRGFNPVQSATLASVWERELIAKIASGKA